MNAKDHLVNAYTLLDEIALMELKHSPVRDRIVECLGELAQAVGELVRKDEEGGGGKVKFREFL